MLLMLQWLLIKLQSRAVLQCLVPVTVSRFRTRRRSPSRRRRTRRRTVTSVRISTPSRLASPTISPIFPISNFLAAPSLILSLIIFVIVFFFFFIFQLANGGILLAIRFVTNACPNNIATTAAFLCCYFLKLIQKTAVIDKQINRLQRTWPLLLFPINKTDGFLDLFNKRINDSHESVS